LNSSTAVQLYFPLVKPQDITFIFWDLVWNNNMDFVSLLFFALVLMGIGTCRGKFFQSLSLAFWFNLPGFERLGTFQPIFFSLKVLIGMKYYTLAHLLVFRRVIRITTSSSTRYDYENRYNSSSLLLQ
jgi:hypothetical protein